MASAPASTSVGSDDDELPTEPTPLSSHATAAPSVSGTFHPASMQPAPLSPSRRRRPKGATEGTAAALHKAGGSRLAPHLPMPPSSAPSSAAAAAPSSSSVPSQATATSTSTSPVLSHAPGAAPPASSQHADSEGEGSDVCKSSWPRGPAVTLLLVVLWCVCIGTSLVVMTRLIFKSSSTQFVIGWFGWLMGIDVWHFLMVLGVVTHGRWRPLVAYKPFARFAAVMAILWLVVNAIEACVLTREAWMDSSKRSTPAILVSCFRLTFFTPGAALGTLYLNQRRLGAPPVGFFGVLLRHVPAAPTVYAPVGTTDTHAYANHSEEQPKPCRTSAMVRVSVYSFCIYGPFLSIGIVGVIPIEGAAVLFMAIVALSGFLVTLLDRSLQPSLTNDIGYTLLMIHMFQTTAFFGAFATIFIHEASEVTAPLMLGFLVVMRFVHEAFSIPARFACPRHDFLYTACTWKSFEYLMVFRFFIEAPSQAEFWRMMAVMFVWTLVVQFDVPRLLRWRSVQTAGLAAAKEFAASQQSRRGRRQSSVSQAQVVAEAREQKLLDVMGWEGCSPRDDVLRVLHASTQTGMLQVLCAGLTFVSTAVDVRLRWWPGCTFSCGFLPSESTLVLTRIALVGTMWLLVSVFAMRVKLHAARTYLGPEIGPMPWPTNADIARQRKALGRHRMFFAANSVYSMLSLFFTIFKIWHVEQ